MISSCSIFLPNMKLKYLYQKIPQLLPLYDLTQIQYIIHIHKMNIKPNSHYPYYSKPPTPTHKKNNPFFGSNSFNRSFEPIRILPSSQIRHKKKSCDRTYQTECLGNSPQTAERRIDFDKKNQLNLQLLKPPKSFAQDCQSIKEKKYFGEKQKKQNIMNIASQKSSIMTFRKNEDGFYTPRNNVSNRKPLQVEWENKSKGKINFELNKEEKISELQSMLSEQISHRLEEIESIMDEENLNLRQHNEYLIDVIRKLQIEDRKNKIKLAELERQVRVLKQKNTAYCQRIQELENNLEEKEDFSAKRGSFQKNHLSQKYFSGKIPEIQGRAHQKTMYPSDFMKKNKVQTFEAEQSFQISQDQNFTLKSFIASEKTQQEQTPKHPRNERKNTPCFLNNFAQEDFSNCLSKQHEIQPIGSLKINKQISSEEAEEEVYSTEQSIMQGLQLELEKYLSVYKQTFNKEVKERCLSLMKRIKSLKNNQCNTSNEDLAEKSSIGNLEYIDS